MRKLQKLQKLQKSMADILIPMSRMNGSIQHSHNITEPSIDSYEHLLPFLMRKLVLTARLMPADPKTSKMNENKKNHSKNRNHWHGKQ